ncbi:16S rRNA (cytidine(1402)-2'-O)-methyltransferase [Deinococcus ruber]|uniref:Ribosomal RNA small subunit methyltransferase I n=1 Tax=Deinococcus ruber TaxID=1848197 RepID=A0A918BY19_9DEIO|nr:16S rRNA (cytidine(1402)-2'-O)-methyltransferase [Deinococcus ruber]GGQ96153.1 ribosomal RNA small subunit methyltransferase I [Deinococcus ruber]
MTVSKAVGCVWLVPTPLGNLGDITLRAIEVLRNCDAVACEDTRRSGQLLTHLGISRPLVRLDAHTMNRAPGILEQYPRLAYVSDAGTPGISDPGAELLRLALELGHRAEVLPGPTAFVPALILSGLDSGRFTFEGFLPRSGRERRERLKAVVERPETSLIYESPHRLHATLTELAALCAAHRPDAPERQASVTRELSKKFEETRRGTLAELAAHFSGGVKGEIVLVLAGAPEQPRPTPDADHSALAAGWAAEGKTLRDIRELLQAAGLRKNDAYELALRALQGVAPQKRGADHQEPYDPD